MTTTERDTTTPSNACKTYRCVCTVCGQIHQPQLLQGVWAEARQRHAGRRRPWAHDGDGCTVPTSRDRVAARRGHHRRDESAQQQRLAAATGKSLGRPTDSALWTKSQMCVPTSRMQRATLSALAKLNYERQNKQELCSSHITGFSTCRTVAQRLPFHEQIVFFLLVCIVKRQEAHGLRTFPIPPHVIGRPSLGDGGKAYGLNRSGTKWYLGASAQPAAGSTTTQTCTGSTALAPMPAARLPAAGLPAG